MRSAFLIFTVAALAFTSLRLADVERQRYALLMGLCQSDLQSDRASMDCLQTVEPRTSWLWDFWYGLTG
jgi:hypothetical protein